jgi:hypothetical protein
MTTDPNWGLIGGRPFYLVQQEQAYVAQQQEEQRRAARRAAFEAAATAMRETGAVCDIRYADASGTGQACRVPAAGRCNACSRAFCLSHRSSDISGVSGLPNRTFYAATDLCAECQRKQIAEAAQAEKKRAKEAKAKREAAVRAEAGLRAERERQDREHAERIAAHELQTNWAATQNHIDALKARIARIPEKGSTHPAVAWIGIPVLLFVILMAIDSVAPSSGLNDASPIGFVYFIIAAMLCWVAWALVKRARRLIRARNIGELRTLAGSLDRGCGDAECRRCYSSL